MSIFILSSFIDWAIARWYHCMEMAEWVVAFEGGVGGWTASWGIQNFITLPSGWSMKF